MDSDLEEDLASLNINFSGIDEDLATFEKDEMVQQALSRGVDLKKYARELERDLKQAELESVNQYVDNNQQVEELYIEMQQCDNVLGRMEEMLHGFQADLGEISAEIKNLQDDSLTMSIKLKNRREVEELLHKFVESSSILPNFSESIMSAGINDTFLDAVMVLSERLKYLEQTEPAGDGSSSGIAPSNTCVGRELAPELEKLKIKAMSKIRDYFTTQFNAIRKPKTNIQMVQQTSLVKYSKLYMFLAQASPAGAEDLRSMYVESMGRTLLSLFKSYYTQITKLDQVRPFQMIKFQPQS
jgi:hypothetical protein